MNTGIYEIVNTVNGKRYVGSATNFKVRWRLHVKRFSDGTHTPRFQASWNKHGAAAFEFRKILICSKENLLFYEQLIMDALRPEYNTAKIAGSAIGVKHSVEARARMSAKLRGNKHLLGHKHSAESRAKMSESHKGRVPSAETRAKLSVTSKARFITDEWRANISAARMGKPANHKFIEAITGNKWWVGRKHSDEARAKISAARSGKKLSKEHRAKISASLYDHHRKETQQ